MTLFQMDFFIFMLVVLLVVGGVFVVLAGFGFSPDSSADAGFAPDSDGKDDGLSQKLNVLSSSVSEADEVISELSDMSKNVLKEFESKYQELLFLYNLIDEKQKNFGKEDAEQLSIDEYSQQVDAAEAKSKKAEINPKFANVLEMAKSGSSVEEIAKQLDMGKGEISLILNLTGGGAFNA